MPPKLAARAAARAERRQDRRGDRARGGDRDPAVVVADGGQRDQGRAAAGQGRGEGDARRLLGARSGTRSSRSATCAGTRCGRPTSRRHRVGAQGARGLAAAVSVRDGAGQRGRQDPDVGHARRPEEAAPSPSASSSTATPSRSRSRYTWDGANYWISVDGKVIPQKGSALMGGGSEWHGIELDDKTPLPFGWITPDKANVYDGAARQGRQGRRRRAAGAAHARQHRRRADGGQEASGSR